MQYLPTLLTIDDSRNAQQNLAWSFWMSSLTILPATLELGPLLTNKEQWKRVFQERRHRTPQEASLFYSILALLVGNWAACAIVPLDWNVPWQVWPIPNAMLGSVFYLIATLLVGCACCKAKYVPIVEVEARMGRKTSGKAAAKSKEETVKSEKKEMVKSEKETPASTPRRAAAAKKSPKRASRASSKSPAAKKKASPSRARSASKTKTPGWKVKSTAASRSPSRTPRRSSRKA